MISRTSKVKASILGFFLGGGTVVLGSFLEGFQNSYLEMAKVIFICTGFLVIAGSLLLMWWILPVGPPKPVGLTREEHILRHKELHSALDELIADYRLHHPYPAPSVLDISVHALVIWSHGQTKNPTPLN